MPAKKIIEAVGSTCAVIGSSIATVTAGPRPGSTPTPVPTAQPMKAHSRLIGVAAVAISGVLGMGIGLVAGYFGGRLDDVLMRLADIQLAFPFILLAIAVIGIVGPSLVTIIVVIGVSSWVIYARIVRGAVLSLREREFVQAALALGSGDGRVVLRHILPNVLTPWLVVATLDMARVIVLESALSFLGLGVQPPTPTWGGMLSLAGLDHMYQAPWLAIYPAAALSLAVFGFNMLGDALRDLLDPRLRGGG